MLPPPPQNLWEAFFTKLVKVKGLSQPALVRLQRTMQSMLLGEGKVIACQHGSEVFHLERLRTPIRYGRRRTSPDHGPLAVRSEQNTNPLLNSLRRTKNILSNVPRTIEQLQSIADIRVGHGTSLGTQPHPQSLIWEIPVSK